MSDDKDDLKGLKVLVDDKGNPVFAWYWHPEIIVTKIELEEKPKEDEHLIKIK